MTISWEPYLDAGEASEADLLQAEQQLGIRFPDDLRDLLRLRQGMAPEPSMVRKFNAHVCNLMHVNARRQGGDYIPRAVEILRGGGYPQNLIPFATGGSQTHFALAYGARQEPSVVYVVLEFGYDDPRVVRPVAATVTDFLEMLESE